jgi:hypothetical protein
VHERAQGVGRWARLSTAASPIWTAHVDTYEVAQHVDDDAVLAIRLRAADGVPVKTLAAESGLSLSGIYALLGGDRRAQAGGPVRAKRGRLAAMPDLDVHAEMLLRLQQRVVVGPRGCWYWPTTSSGSAARVQIGGRSINLRRTVVQVYLGMQPERRSATPICEYVVDEDGAHGVCVSPVHLVPTSSDVALASLSAFARQCPNGHIWGVPETRIKRLGDGRHTRVCRSCTREARQHQLQQRACALNGR